MSDRLLGPGSDLFQFSKGTSSFIEATVGTCEEEELFDFFKSGTLLQGHVHMGFKGSAGSIQGLIRHIQGYGDQALHLLRDDGLPPDFSTDPDAKLTKVWIDAEKSLLKVMVIGDSIRHGGVGVCVHGFMEWVLEEGDDRLRLSELLGYRPYKAHRHCVH